MPVNRKEVRLKPMSLRVSPIQYDKLSQLRDIDGLSIQEHVRRAIDHYLNPMVMLNQTPELATPVSAPPTSKPKAKKARTNPAKSPSQAPPAKVTKKRAAYALR